MTELIVPRRWQLEALDAWKRSGLRGTFSVVTGAGKTVFAAMCINHVLSAGPRSVSRSFVLVPTEALLYQWRQSLVKILGISPADITLIGAGNRPKSLTKYNIAISRSSAQIVRLCSATGDQLLIADEVHHLGASCASHLASLPSACSVGLSATPHRTYDRAMEEHVFPNIGPICFSYGYEEALRDGVIVPFNLTYVRVPVSSEEEVELRKMARSIASAVDSGDAELARRLMIRRSAYSNAIIGRRRTVGPLIQHFGLSRGIVFAGNIEQVELIAKSVVELGRRVDRYHSKMTKAARVLALTKYMGGITDILVTCSALDEGFDVPDTSFALLVASSNAERRRIQRMGRALRPSIGKSRADVLAMYATESEREALESDARRYQNLVKVAWVEGVAT